MSMAMDDSIERWTAMRKSALVIKIIQGKTTVAAASRSFELTPSEIEVEQGIAIFETKLLQARRAGFDRADVKVDGFGHYPSPFARPPRGVWSRQTCQTANRVAAWAPDIGRRSAFVPSVRRHSEGYGMTQYSHIVAQSTENRGPPKTLNSNTSSDSQNPVPLHVPNDANACKTEHHCALTAPPQGHHS